MSTTTTTTINPLNTPPTSYSPVAPSGLVFPNNDKLTNANMSSYGDMDVFNPYIHYYPKASPAEENTDSASLDPTINLDGAQDVAYRIAFAEDYEQSSTWDLYSEEYRNKITTTSAPV